MRIMGFAGFDTTKNKPVEDNHHGAALGTVSKHKKRVYRQYMNRKGIFLTLYYYSSSLSLHILLTLDRWF